MQTHKPTIFEVIILIAVVLFITFGIWAIGIAWEAKAVQQSGVLNVGACVKTCTPLEVVERPVNNVNLKVIESDGFQQSIQGIELQGYRSNGQK